MSIYLIIGIIITTIIFLGGVGVNIWYKRKYSECDGLLMFVTLIVCFFLIAVTFSITNGLEMDKLKAQINSELKSNYNIEVDLDRQPDNKYQKLTIRNYNEGKMVGPYIANRGDTFLNLYLRNDNGTVKVYTCDNNEYYNEIQK